MELKVGDWVTYGLDIGQITELRDEGHATFSDGCCSTSGRLADGVRPLTLKSKRAVEQMDFYYKMLKEIDGEAGFNYPDISRYFERLALDLIDGIDPKTVSDKAAAFIHAAREYQPVIDGVALFRRRVR